MELDDLKTAWQVYDQRLQTAQQSTDQLVQIITRDRSASVLDKMIRETRLTSFILSAEVVFLIATVVSNAFDYPNALYHLPAVLFTLVALIGLYVLMVHYRQLRRANLYSRDMHQALLELINLRLQFNKAMTRVWAVIMMSAMLINISLVACKLTQADLINTLLLVLLPISVTAFAFGVAKWLGAFEDQYVKQLKNQLGELEALRRP